MYFFSPQIRKDRVAERGLAAQSDKSTRYRAINTSQPMRT